MSASGGTPSATGPRVGEDDPAVGRARVVHAGAADGPPSVPLGTVAVIVPTYNTTATVPGVLRSLVSAASDLISEILVIDNASTDDTAGTVAALIAADAEIAAKVTLVSNPHNLGYGGSIKRGLDATIGRVDLVAVIHSDDQCDAGATLLTLLGGLEASPGVDVVLASRFTRGADLQSYSAVRRAGNAFFNTVTRLVSGYAISDAGTAIMVARTTIFAEFPIDRLTSGYRFHPQLNLLFYGSPRLTICEVPLAWHDASLENRFSLTVYGLRLLKMLTVFGWRRRVRGWSLFDAVVAAEPLPDRGDG